MRALLVAAFLALTLPAVAQTQRLETTDVVRLADTDREWTVEVAETGREQAVGLMNRLSMPARTGMLFDFGASRDVTMWMRNTLIPLDMVFVCADGTVARVGRGEPLSEAIVASGEPVRYVLEINAGEAAAAGISRGAKLETLSGERFDGTAEGCGA